MKPSNFKQLIYNFCIDKLQFDDCRFTDPHLGNLLNEYKAWLKTNCPTDMDYLQKHLKFKENPQLLLEGVRCAIVVIKNYKNTSERKLNGKFKIARYAVGEDYHVVIKERLEQLAEFIKIQNPEIKCYTGVDSRPIAERALAIKSGIGFLGKNAMVIKPGLGSYFFIGVILTTHPFENDNSLKWNCGACRLCLDACPTNALSTPYTLDASKCISFQTIEQKTALSETELQNTKGWIFGCDICQEVCPYNHDKTPLTNWEEFLPEAGVGFDFFKNKANITIPKKSAIYRSRKRVAENLASYDSRKASI